MKSACCLAEIEPGKSTHWPVIARQHCSKCHKPCTEAVPDGYCAWHPEKGWLIDETEHQASATLKARIIRHRETFRSAEARAEAEGWRIRPVKIVPLED